MAEEASVIFGDSHIVPFDKIDYCQTKRYDSASAQGLINPRSKTQTGEKIRKYIQEKELKRIFLHFGKVDMDFLVLYKQATRKDITWKKQIEISTNALISFAQSLGDADVTFIGLTLPTLNEKQMKEVLDVEQTFHNVSKLAGIDKPSELTIKIPLLELRTLYVIMFNKILQHKAYQYGFKYIDIVEETLNYDTGIVDDFFISREQNPDIHCDPKRIADVYRGGF